MSRIVVTGASGFVASRLLPLLGRERASLVAVSRRERCEPTPDNCEWVSVASYEDLQLSKSDWVIHLAESAVASDYASKELVERQNRVLERLLNKAGPRFIYVSSAAVYGDSESLRHREDEQIIPASPYGQYKLRAETHVLSAGGRVARPANLYGPGMSSINVLSDALGQLSSDGPVRMRSLGAVRDYLWIDDFVAGLARLQASAIGGCFNFGTGIGTSVAKLVEVILEIAGQKGRSIEASFEGDEPSELLLDATKAKEALGWIPETNLRKGLEQLVLQK